MNAGRMDLAKIKHICISRTDSIGDVMFTLPMTGILKKKIPGVRISFIGRFYTRAVIQACTYVDQFIDLDALIQLPVEEQILTLKKLSLDVVLHVFPNKHFAKICKAAAIPIRIGTSHRWYHWWTCNYWVHFSRKNSNLHEAQLNLKLLKPLHINFNPACSEISNFYGMENIEVLHPSFQQILHSDKIKIILHPKSKGSAREWGEENFGKLIQLLSPEKYQIFISGTATEGELLRDWMQPIPHVIDITGQLSLAQFIAFIKQIDVLIAASTGPLHIAAALGKKAIGLYAPMIPIHPGRWAPLGPQAKALVIQKPNCMDCKSGGVCSCIQSITPVQVLEAIESQEFT